MKTKSILWTTGLLVLLVALLFGLSSCSKKADGNMTKEQIEQDKNLQASAIDDKDLAETDEDLLSVDYKEFYDQLAPHGEWVQVKPEEIGLQPKTAMNNNSGSDMFSPSDLMGIRNIYASTEANVEMVYVWRPSSDLAVTTVAGEAPVYVPYTNGQWVNTDAGWYFKAPTPYEETTSHYGRWVNSPTAGWLWVPGRVWAPAWVDWKQNDNYVSWAPLPPSVYLVNGTMSTPVIQDNNYTIVERRYFIEPDVYKYNTVYYDNGSRILLSDLTGTQGIVVVNNTIVNRGPDVLTLQTFLGRTIDLVTIQHVRSFDQVVYSNGQYRVYTPVFQRFKNKDNTRIIMNGPKSYKKYDEWKEMKSIDKQYKKDQKEYRKEEKQIRKGNVGDDSHMYYDKNKGNNGNDNGKKNYNNDNGKKNNGNDNGQKNNGNDNGKKNNGNDNGKKNNGNDNGKQHEGKDKGNGKK